MLLDFELLLLLEQNLFYPWVFIFFFSLWSQDGEAPVNMVLRGDVWVKLTQCEWSIWWDWDRDSDLEAVGLHTTPQLVFQNLKNSETSFCVWI